MLQPMRWFKRPPFTIDHFMAQMDQIWRLGPLGRVVGMLPGMRKLVEQLRLDEAQVERQMIRMRAIYDSMNRQERAMPDLLNGSRRRRIADGAGVRVQEVIHFIRQFEMTRDMMRRLQGN